MPPLGMQTSDVRSSALGSARIAVSLSYYYRFLPLSAGPGAMSEVQRRAQRGANIVYYAAVIFLLETLLLAFQTGLLGLNWYGSKPLLQQNVVLSSIISQAA